MSRSKIDLYLRCKRCAYLDMRLQIKGPKPFPYNLNSRIDTLLKNEFDVARKNKARQGSLLDFIDDFVSRFPKCIDDYETLLSH